MPLLEMRGEEKQKTLIYSKNILTQSLKRSNVLLIIDNNQCQ